jgi:hypothetical protein
MAVSAGVVILGPDRSGTSVTASVAAALGAKVSHGSRADEFNPRGYWENEEITRINEKICTYLGVNPTWVPPPEFDWTGFRPIRRLLPTATTLVRKLESDPLWACKDPKFSITLPFWKPLFSGQVKYLICLRNPLSVARSLNHRDGFKISTSSRYWFLWMRNALMGTSGEKRLIVRYEDYLQDSGRDPIRRIAGFLDLQNLDAASGLFSASLDHASATDLDAARSSGLRAETRSLYSLLRETESGQQSGDAATESLRLAAKSDNPVETRLRILSGGVYNRLGVLIYDGLQLKGNLFRRY